VPLSIVTEPVADAKERVEHKETITNKIRVLIK
jgi:hypothetical protein